MYHSQKKKWHSYIRREKTGKNKIMHYNKRETRWIHNDKIRENKKQLNFRIHEILILNVFGYEQHLHFP